MCAEVRTGVSTRQSAWSEHLLFLGRFLRNPRRVGAVAPSSRCLARQMMAAVDLGPAVRLVELGPGTGAFTREIVARLSPGARYLVVDVDPTFVARLRRRWPELDCVCASASTLPALAAERGLTRVDHIVSGLPFASLPVETTRSILDAIDAILRVGGTFTTFQYVHAFRLPPAVAFRRDMTARLGAPPQMALVVRNLPPAQVLTWRRAL
jgi:phosphatidylethanolamine/phosphatidyl-N-methylethanolamine N-methyltransferase